MKYSPLFFLLSIFVTYNAWSQCDSSILILDHSFESGLSLSECAMNNETGCGWEIDDGGFFTQADAKDGTYSIGSSHGGAYQYIDLQANTNYTLSCWIKINAGEFYLRILENGGIYAADSWNGLMNNWQQVTLDFTTGTTNLNKRIWFYSENAYADLFELCSNGTVGLNENLMDNYLSISPNPSSNLINIQTELNIDFIEVIDITGKTIKSFSTNSNTIDVGDLTYGIYFIKVKCGNEVFTKKFVKK